MPSSQGKKLSLKDFKKQIVVLYFYPKDDTPGCTTEACGFRDGIKEIQGQGAVVLGVSMDNLESHTQFIKKFNLPFTLLSDTDAKVCKKYGVYKQKEYQGKKYMGIERTTFIIDKEGRIARIFPQVNPQGHETEVITAIRSMP